MEIFRKLYYKIVTLFCMISTFAISFNTETMGIGYGCFCILVGLMYFGSFSVGKEQINPDKPIRNILLLLLWSLLGFGVMSMGILALIGTPENNSLLIAFLVMAGLCFLVAYVISIIKNKDWYAIISIALVVLGFVIGSYSNGMLILQILTLATFLASIVCFILSFIKGLTDD